MLFLERGGNDTFVGFHVFLVFPTCSMLTKLQCLYILITYLMDVYNHLESSLWLNIVKAPPTFPSSCSSTRAMKLALRIIDQSCWKVEENSKRIIDHKLGHQTGLPCTSVRETIHRINNVLKRKARFDLIQRIIDHSCWKEKEKLISITAVEKKKNLSETTRVNSNRRIINKTVENKKKTTKLDSIQRIIDHICWKERKLAKLFHRRRRFLNLICMGWFLEINFRERIWWGLVKWECPSFDPGQGSKTHLSMMLRRSSGVDGESNMALENKLESQNHQNHCQSTLTFQWPVFNRMNDNKIQFPLNLKRLSIFKSRFSVEPCSNKLSIIWENTFRGPLKIKLWQRVDKLTGGFESVAKGQQ